MTTPLEYAQHHRDTFRAQLNDLLRIPSISTDPTRKPDMQRAADWLVANFASFGIQAEVLPTAGHPVVYAEWLGAGADKPTLLIYGHYDVQPADRAKDSWTSEPFDPVERDGKIYARGSSDDKGQLFIHLKALESYLKTTGSAPVNVKFLLEGEEEIGSPNLVAFVGANKERLKADLVVISDTGMRDIDQPAITYSLRGLTYMEIHVTGPIRDLHSGGYGGIVHNPALALVEILSKMHHADHSIAVPGFYDDVLPLTDDERAVIAQSSISADRLIEETSVPQPWGEAAYTIRERQTARPTLEINGLFSGFIGEGSKTVLPARAMAKVSCRLVANQDPHRIFELVRDYVASITPPTVTTEVRLLNMGDAARIDYTTPAMRAASRAYARGWGKEPIFTREGGSIPIVADFKRELGLDSVLMGYGLNTDGAHGPDEHFTIEMFHKGIDTAIAFMDEIAQG
jgi:acetylornithine deacetylase/succinyl-diaminopimelate desuccinylase-like protein